MYSIETFIELPIAVSNAYDTKGNILPTLTGCNYFVTVSLTSNELDRNGMVVDFKKMKKIIHEYFDQYDHSLILTPENPLAKAYLDNFKENGIDAERSRLFIWKQSPTAEYMSYYWYQIFKKKFIDVGIDVSKLVIQVEETSHNSVEYTED